MCYLLRSRLPPSSSGEYTASDSVCLGSNPGSPAKPSHPAKVPLQHPFEARNRHGSARSVGACARARRCSFHHFKPPGFDTIQSRHCEPTGRANARPMINSAKQSISPSKERMDCFVASLPCANASRLSQAMTLRQFHPCLCLLAARYARVLMGVRPRKQEGAGNAGCTPHPRSRTQNGEWVRARAYGLSGGIRHPLRNGFTAYAVLSPATNSSCHRRRRILRLPNPVGSRLATADLAPATGVRTTRFCRTLKRRSSCVPEHRSRGSTRPATSMARRRSRVHHIPSHVRDDARPPLLSEQDGAN